MRLLHVLSGCLLVLAFGSLTSHAGDKKDDAPLVVLASKPVQRKVTDFADYTGRTRAKDSVTIQARVTGHLVKIAFKEGTEVKEGDVLFEIDSREYQAQAVAAKAKIALAEATLKQAKATNERFKDLVKKGVVAQEEADQAQLAEGKASAGLELGKAELQTALLKLDWTVIRAPIAGRISEANLSVGNLVKREETELATLVSTGPIYVYFDVDERTMLRLRGAGKDEVPRVKDFAVLIGLADEDGYPHRGAIDFVGNQVNANTGTIRMRAVFANPKAKDGMPLLMPGMFVRVRVPLGGQPYEALLVTERAIVLEKETKSVWVVNAENKVELRRVALGSRQSDGLRVIEEGLKKDDLVVVGGVNQLRAGMHVQPKLVAMPTPK